MGKILVGVAAGALCDVRRNRNGCPTDLRSHGVQLVIGKFASQPIHLSVQGSRGLPHVQPFKADSRLHKTSILTEDLGFRALKLLFSRARNSRISPRSYLASCTVPAPRPSTLDTRLPQMVARTGIEPVFRP